MHEVPIALRHDFIDEDTDTWIAAAISIGRLGESSWPFIEAMLGQTENIHARRHAWTSVASRFRACDQPDDLIAKVVLTDWDKSVDNDSSPERIRIRKWVADRLADAVIEGLQDTSTTLSVIEEFRGFSDLKQSRISRLEAELAQMQAADNTRAITDKQRRIALWKSGSTLLSEVLETRKNVLPQDPWVLASFIAGTSLGWLRSQDLDPTLAMLGLTALARRGGDNIAYVANLPFAIDNSGKAESNLVSGKLLPHLLANLPSISPDTHWSSYLIRLEELTDRFDVSAPNTVSEAVSGSLPENLGRFFLDWESSRSEEATIRLIRACEGTFCDETKWKEHSSEHQLAFSIFHRLLIAPGIPENQIKVLNLQHRIRVVWTSIMKWRASNPLLLMSLVRLIKTLFFKEMSASDDNRRLNEICHRQVGMILPLLAQWDLRGTCKKDLATISSRALSACRGNHPPVESSGGYVGLLYKVLFALPEDGFVEEVVLYAQDSVVEKQFRQLNELIVAFKNPKSKDLILPNPLSPLIWDADQYSESTGESLSSGRADHEQLLHELMRHQTFAGQPLSLQSRTMLMWMIEVRLRATVEAEAGFPAAVDSTTLSWIEGEALARTKKTMRKIDSGISRLALSERQVRDAAENPNGIGYLLRKLIDDLLHVELLFRENLPYPERFLTTTALQNHIRDREKQLRRLSAVLDGEDEALATRIVQGSEADSTDGEKQLVSQWMLGRFMIRELANDHPTISRIIDWKRVATLILAPYLLSAVIYQVWGGAQRSLTAPWICGVPFIASLVVAIGLLLSSVRIRGSLPKGVVGISLLLPQMIGTLFLGIMESFRADEFWSTGFFSDPFIRSVNLLIFLGASFYFVRYVILRGQNPKSNVPTCEDSTLPRLDCVLRRRTIDLLSLGMMQAFAFVMVFSLLAGAVMGSEFRADLAFDALDSSSRFVGGLLPLAIVFGNPGSLLSMTLYPVAILTWTVQVFFFSAIFERILGNRSSQ